MKAYPNAIFRSLQHYEGYLKCASKLKLGDTVQFYCYSDGGRLKPSTHQTDYILDATVIATGSNPDTYPPVHKEIILGRKDDRVAFWDIYEQPFIGLDKIKNLNEFQKGWSVRFGYGNYVRDILIHKIIRQ